MTYFTTSINYANYLRAKDPNILGLQNTKLMNL